MSWLFFNARWRNKGVRRQVSEKPCVKVFFAFLPWRSFGINCLKFWATGVFSLTPEHWHLKPGHLDTQFFDQRNLEGQAK